MGKRRDITNTVFGRLTAKERLGVNKHKQSVWRCDCSCGNSVSVVIGGLVTGNTKSCGCYAEEVLLTSSKTHGLCYSPEYSNWCDMRKRCSPNSSDNQDYAARGINVHEDFNNSFVMWLDEIGRKPTDGQRWSVGRKDNNLGYTYGNLQWEVDTQQARNHSKQKNNTSGVTGVGFNKKSNSWSARWRELSGKTKSKDFSIIKYGEQEAKILAVEYRKLMIAELNKLGAGYAESHGADK